MDGIASPADNNCLHSQYKLSQNGSEAYRLFVWLLYLSGNF